MWRGWKKTFGVSVVRKVRFSACRGVGGGGVGSSSKSGRCALVGDVPKTISTAALSQRGGGLICDVADTPFPSPSSRGTPRRLLVGWARAGHYRGGSGAIHVRCVKLQCIYVEYLLCTQVRAHVSLHRASSHRARDTRRRAKNGTHVNAGTWRTTGRHSPHVARSVRRIPRADPGSYAGATRGREQHA